MTTPLPGVVPVKFPMKDVTNYIENARGSQTVVDMAGPDNKTIIGWPLHGDSNQQWSFIPSGDGYLIQNGRKSQYGEPLYLTVSGDVEDGQVVCDTQPAVWHVKQRGECVL